jgi:bifunctional UDP-N-acetylglucosamine pyrophosphorylase/glucosamine-1-phosphate N-acetyltransferase
LIEALGIGVYGEGIAVLPVEDPSEAIDIDDRTQLAEAERVMRQRICLRLMLSGVTIVDPATTYIDDMAEVGEDTVISPNTQILGRTRIGAKCHIGPNSHIEDSVIGEDCRITASTIEGATLDAGVDVGPYSHLRPGTVIETAAHIGNYVEVKNARLGRDTKVGHFSYLGDAVIGANVNIGAGTITCNFDGIEKHQTTIEDDVFVGSDTMLVAPVSLGKGAKTGAGAVVTRDVPAGSTVVGVPARSLEKNK